MRKILAIITAVCSVALGIVAVSQPAQATWDWGKQASTAVQKPQAPAAAATGWAMGGMPNYWTVCAINGVGGTYWPNLVRQWDWAGHELDLIVGNRCDGYSTTNKFTFKYYNDPGDSNCAKIIGTKTWNAARGKYVWNAPTLWVNIRDGCADNPTEYDHNVQEYVGWLLGLYPDAQNCDCVMGNTTEDRNSVRYVVIHDILDMNVIYNH